MGHKTSGMTDRYTHVEDSDLHDAVARMGSATRTATELPRIPNAIKEALDNIVIDQRNWNGPRRDRTCDPLIKSPSATLTRDHRRVLKARNTAPTRAAAGPAVACRALRVAHRSSTVARNLARHLRPHPRAPH
jgi:hypothetical protein